MKGGTDGEEVLETINIRMRQRYNLLSEFKNGIFYCFYVFSCLLDLWTILRINILCVNTKKQFFVFYGSGTESKIFIGPGGAPHRTRTCVDGAPVSTKER